MQEETVQEGVVTSVGAEQITVRIEKKDEDCDGCCACKLKSLCRGRADEYMELSVPMQDGRERPVPGETVQVAYRATNAAVAAAIMFVPALVGLFFGGFIGNRFWGEGDGIFIVGCLAGLVVGLGLTFVVSRASTILRPEIRLL